MRAIGLLVALLAAINVRCGTVEDAAQAFMLKLPIAITKVVRYGDGGTVGVIVTDHSGAVFRFCLDGRRGVDDDSIATQKVFLHATHPEDAGAKAIGIGSKEELHLSVLLNDWLAETRSSVKLLLSRDDQLDGDLTKQERPGSALCRIIEILKSRQRRSSPFRGKGDDRP